MEDRPGPVEQMEAIIRDETLKLSADQMRMHAETILLAAMHQKPMIHGWLLFKASGQGLEYTTGVAMAIALLTRNWSRVVADDPDLDIAQYLEDDEDCDMPLAHEMVRRAIRAVESVADADVIREEMHLFAEKYDAQQFGRLMVHFIYLCANLTTSVLDIADAVLAKREADGRDR